MKAEKLVHISMLPCWTCKWLKYDKASQTYRCPKNRHLPEFLPSYFASNCTLYEKRKKNEKFSVKIIKKYCPKIRETVELTVADSKVIKCNMESKCHAWCDDGFCWIGHTIETGKVGAERIG